MSKTSTWSLAMTRNVRGECNSIKVGCYGIWRRGCYKKGSKVTNLEGERNIEKNVTN